MFPISILIQGPCSTVGLTENQLKEVVKTLRVKSILEEMNRQCQQQETQTHQNQSQYKKVT